MNDNRQIDETGRPEQDDARAWVVLLASGKVTADQAAAFRKWHASHPAHAHAFAEVKQHWNIIGQATHELARDVVPADGPRRNIAPSVSRRWVLGTGAVAAGIAVLALRPPLDLWSPLVDFSADYRTGIGELQTIAMGQNVTVELSTRSRLALRSDRPDGLRVALLAGEAAVASDSRSVSVIAGDGETRVTSGRFNLRNDDGVVRVTCLAGTIDVTCGDRQVALHASQQTSYSGQGLVAPTAADAEEISGWQRGILVFRNQPLRHVIDEVNRYRSGKIVLLSEDLGNRPVAVASFHLDRLDDVISQMEAVYGAKARRLPGGIVLLSYPSQPA